MKQFWIAADQWVNTWVPPYSGPDQGWADETLSSRAWRMSDTSKNWKRFHDFLNWVFLKFMKQPNHCFESYVAERLLRHMPPELRTVDVPKGSV